MSFLELLKANLKGIYRNQSGLFWTLIIPVTIYVALSVLPIGKALDIGFNYSHYVLPGILAMQVMQGGIYGLAYWMVDLRSRGVIKRFLVTPISNTELVISLLVARVTVMFLQAIVLTAVGVLFFHAEFAWNILPILVFIMLGGGIFLLLGLLISRIADTYESAAPLTAAIGLPLTFLGNIFYPISALPSSLQHVAAVLPITYLADGLRKLYSAPFNFHDISKDLGMLVLWFVVILGITLWRFRLEE